MRLAAAVSLTLALTAPALAQPPAAQPSPAIAPDPLPRLEARIVRSWTAPEATQGVAVDRRHFYAVANSRIAKYERTSGRKVAEWRGERARFPHINHCAVLERALVCAASNFPATPMWSAVEIFDPKRMVHLRTVALGRQVGSLTWIDRKDGAWWAGFANYDGRGGEPGRGHQYTELVKFDDDWRRLESWVFPPSVLASFAPTSSSGGAWGEDGLLYVTGHDAAEVYVLRLPKGGAVLDHLATIDAPINGQAIVFDRSGERLLFGIRRPTGEVVEMLVPPVAPALSPAPPAR